VARRRARSCSRTTAPCRLKPKRGKPSRSSAGAGVRSADHRRRQRHPFFSGYQPGKLHAVYSIQQRLAGTETRSATTTDRQASAVARPRAPAWRSSRQRQLKGRRGRQTPRSTCPEQDALISAVPRPTRTRSSCTTTNSRDHHAWLNQVAGYRGFYDGQDWARPCRRAVRRRQPSGHLPVTFPTRCPQGRPAAAAQWRDTTASAVLRGPGHRLTGGTDRDQHDPAVPFGFGLSDTSFLITRNLQVGALVGNRETVTATVTNHREPGRPPTSPVYVGDPGRDGEPPHQLIGDSSG